MLQNIHRATCNSEFEKKGTVFVRSHYQNVASRTVGGLSLWFGSFFLLTILGCEPPPHIEQREISAATITIALDGKTQDLERPAVEFEHAQHTAALEKDCAACHLKDNDKFVFKFAHKDNVVGRDELMDLYHDKCIGCHKDRADLRKDTGPRACADCHAKKPSGVSLRKEMSFDYSLHYRHVKATGEEKCDTCHHLYDEAQKKLVYKKSAEDACSDCHGKVDDGKNLSLKNASHTSCVTCHLDAKAEGKKHGPVLCAGCHDAKGQAGFEKLEPTSIPRLERGQKEIAQIKLADAKSDAVDFDHRAHEGRATFCTTCHHKTPKPCKECHTLTGIEKGDGVTAAQAYHLASSERSCVGCHMEKTNAEQCAGCHSLPTENTPPSKRTCAVCHAGSSTPGPLPGPPPVDDLTMGVGVEELPPTSDSFPETVVIKTLAKEYKASTMPHRRIVERLHKSITDSKLATTFHGHVEVVCAGCHHQSPVTSKPRPCSACHSDSKDKAKDKPELRAAYHRQCMGCHREMKLEKAMGCTDCHEKADVKEVTQ